MTTRSATLRSTRDGLGSRHLWATLRADGTLIIEGQDLGSGVGGAWGSGLSEYEWAETIQPEDVAKLAAALGSGDDVVAALAKRYSDDPSFILKRFLDEHGIPYRFWSHVGG
jgi:hypothetical protein